SLAITSRKTALLGYIDAASGWVTGGTPGTASAGEATPASPVVRAARASVIAAAERRAARIMGAPWSTGPAGGSVTAEVCKLREGWGLVTCRRAGSGSGCRRPRCQGSVYLRAVDLSRVFAPRSRARVRGRPRRRGARPHGSGRRRRGVRADDRRAGCHLLR